MNTVGGGAEARSSAGLLWDCWTNGRRLASIPEDIRPRTREEGYAVQALLEERSAEPLLGWKIAATSTAGQAHINVTGPLAGRLLAEKVIDLSRRPVRRSFSEGGSPATTYPGHETVASMGASSNWRRNAGFRAASSP
jgi:hypothetical protein